MKRGFMMILKQKKVKPTNEDTTNRRNPGSTSVHQIIQQQERFISNSIDLKILIGASNP